MNKIALTLLLGVTFLSCNTNKNDKDTSTHRRERETLTIDQEAERVTPNVINYTLSGKRAGDFTVGAPIPTPTAMDSYTVKKEQETRTAEGETYEETYYVITAAGEELVHLLPDPGNTDTIGEIVVISPRYKTDKNIGVDATVEAFMKAYPEHKLWYTYVSDMYVIETDAATGQFILDASGFTGKVKVKSDMTTLKSGDFKKDTKIKKIRIL